MNPEQRLQQYRLRKQHFTYDTSNDGTHAMTHKDPKLLITTAIPYITNLMLKFNILTTDSFHKTNKYSLILYNHGPMRRKTIVWNASIL
jgi:hypothetical protein